MSVQPEKQPADWSKYETNATSPGIYILTPEQQAEFWAEITVGTCPTCSQGLINSHYCHHCDMLMPPRADRYAHSREAAHSREGHPKRAR